MDEIEYLEWELSEALAPFSGVSVSAQWVDADRVLCRTWHHGELILSGHVCSVAGFFDLSERFSIHQSGA